MDRVRGVKRGRDVIMKDSKERFADRAETYEEYRPRYPREMLDLLRQEIGLTPEWAIADIGSETGLSSQLFVENGNPVYEVEPNDAMRARPSTGSTSRSRTRSSRGS